MHSSTIELTLSSYHYVVESSGTNESLVLDLSVCLSNYLMLPVHLAPQH